jgi:hypothetical protein
MQQLVQLLKMGLPAMNQTILFILQMVQKFSASNGYERKSRYDATTYVLAAQLL